MRIPKQIKAYGFKYPVIQQKRIKGGFIGEINHHQQKIKLVNNGKYSKRIREESLLHELIHLVHNQEGIKMKEGEVDHLSKGLYHVLKDNNLLK